MVHLSRILTLVLTSFLFGCSSVVLAEGPERETGTIKLLTLGDSRVEGAPPVFESYRYELWKQIIKSDMSIDFIGPLRDGYRYANENSQVFDADHAGVGGFTTQDVLENLDDVLSATFDPDVVLLGIGGNDLIGTNQSPEAIAGNVALIIKRLRAEKPNVIILVEQIVPGKPEFMSERLTRKFENFNHEIGALAPRLTSNASPIIIVDMTVGWKAEYLADDVHYNTSGAKHIARKYFEALHEIIQR